jgi:hypothetical protein
MQRITTYLSPRLGSLPGCISLAMLADLLRCLPRPQPDQSRDYGRQLIQDALAMLDAIAPRDRLEAELAVQMLALHAQARPALMRAAAEQDPDRQMRLQRHAMALQRRAEAQERSIARHRRTLAREGEVHVAPPGWEYDLDALEAAWRDPAAELPAAALRQQELEIPTFGAKQAEAEEAPPARVPLWQQAGRQYLDELTDEELREVVRVHGRGEPFPEPPMRPEGMEVPPQEFKPLSQEEIAAMTPAQRWQRYGAWTEQPE